MRERSRSWRVPSGECDQCAGNVLPRVAWIFFDPAPSRFEPSQCGMVQGDRSVRLKWLDIFTVKHVCTQMIVERRERFW